LGQALILALLVLLPLPLPLTNQIDPDTAGTHEKRYMCAVSGKQITFQAAVLLKKANAVILEKVFNDLVVPTMACPLTGEKLKVALKTYH